jgi:hypothetical protein
MAGLDLDRINNNSGYNPNNCRWVTHSINLQNTRRKLETVICGEKINLCQISQKYNLSYTLLYRRFKKGLRGDDLIAKRNN